jgi:hypothetical protein
LLFYFIMDPCSRRVHAIFPVESSFSAIGNNKSKIPCFQTMDYSSVSEAYLCFKVVLESQVDSSNRNSFWSVGRYSNNKFSFQVLTRVLYQTRFRQSNSRMEWQMFAPNQDIKAERQCICVCSPIASFHRILHLRLVLWFDTPNSCGYFALFQLSLRLKNMAGK